MAPDTDTRPDAGAPEPRRRRSTVVIGATLIAAGTAAALWVTGVAPGATASAANPVNAPTTTVAQSPTTPAPAATPTGDVAAASASTPQAAPDPNGPRNLLLSADGSLDTSVTTYSDCSGQTELTHAAAAIDTCVTGRTYFVGHNAGVFTPLLNLGVGDVITYYDGNGVAHRLRIVAVRDNWLRDMGVPPLAEPGVVAQFQTCETAYPDGSHDRILDAVAA